MFEYKAVVEKIVDGDTIDVDLDLGFDVHVKQRIRLARINCPEMKTDEGKPAKSYTATVCPTGSSVTIKTTKTDKYGRYIGEVLFMVKTAELNLSDEIVKAGFAEYVRY